MFREVYYEYSKGSWRTRGKAVFTKNIADMSCIVLRSFLRKFTKSIFHFGCIVLRSIAFLDVKGCSAFFGACFEAEIKDVLGLFL